MTIEPVSEYPEQTFARFNGIAGDTEILRRYLAKGNTFTWRIDGGRAWALVRAEPETEALWVICYQGEGVIEFLRYLREQLKGHFKRIVFHTEQEAVARLARRAGATKLGIICGVDI